VRPDVNAYRFLCRRRSSTQRCVRKTRLVVEPWLSALVGGKPQAAWDLFSERYRGLMLATIRRLVRDDDDVMDVFSSACQALVTNDFARLRRYAAQESQRASAATWTVAVVRNLTIDWLREQDGRQRRTVPDNLSALQREIYRAICLDGLSRVEAHGTISARSSSGLTFGEFLREVTATQRAAPCADEFAGRRSAHVPLSDELPGAVASLDPAEAEELARRIADALAEQPADVRLAVELFVVERMPAADVARVVGWPNGKAVYNRVYRALASIRVSFESKGLDPSDLA